MSFQIKWEIGDIYRQSSVKTPTSKNISSNLYGQWNENVYIYETEQVIKVLSQINRMKNLFSTICLTQSLAN